MKINRDCESFTQLLLDHTEIVIDGAWQAHLRGCKSCRHLWATHNQSITSLKERVTLSAESQQKIFSRLQQTIQSSQKSETNHWVSRLTLWISTLNPRYAIPALVLFIGFTLAAFIQPSSSMMMNGPATVLVETNKVFLDLRQKPMVIGKSLWLLDGQLHLAWNNQETIAVEGRLEFSALEKGLKPTKGKAVLSFSRSAEGYQVAMRHTILKIVGTVIRIEMSDTSETVVVDKGRVLWELHDGSRKGELTAGTGIVVKVDSKGQIRVDERTGADLEGLPESLGTASDGVKLIKNGNNWIKSPEPPEKR